MPQFERFTENLIEMRSHYAAQIQKYDLAIAQAQDSLSHLNALLVDETHNNQQFLQTLIQMRSHYQNLVDESHRHSASAKGQLNHINALLAEQLVMQHGEHRAISMQARTVEERQTLAEASTVYPHPLPQVVTEPLKESIIDSVSPENIDLEIGSPKQVMMSCSDE